MCKIFICHVINLENKCFYTKYEFQKQVIIQTHIFPHSQLSTLQLISYKIEAYRVKVRIEPGICRLLIGHFHTEPGITLENNI